MDEEESKRLKLLLELQPFLIFVALTGRMGVGAKEVATELGKKLIKYIPLALAIFLVLYALLTFFGVV